MATDFLWYQMTSTEKPLPLFFIFTKTNMKIIIKL